MSRTPTWLLACLTLVIGFALARVTGVRALGAVVLLAGVGWCLAREVRATPWWRLAVVVVVGAVCFVASHVLADRVGAWPSVLLCSAALGASTALLIGGRRRVAQPAGRPGWGRRATEWLLTYVGPAQIGDPRRPARAATADERAREEELRTTLVREVGPDGTTYLVERRD
ncbi:hypothetical protein ACTHAM_003007 [Cellulomonas soli]|uniref:hypothetical protein n=1 Tax=Cellulomonas soli TaxID=931535 RepID=UPI003F87F8BD